MSIELDLLSALRRLAPPSTPADADRFNLTVGQQAFEVVYQGGSSSSLTLEASYDRAAKYEGSTDGAGYRTKGGLLRAPRPLTITLRREDAADVEAKTMKIATEYQTGDPAFDRAVYVDSPTTDPRVLSAILHEGTRAAVLALLALDIPQISIDDEGMVRIRLTGFLSTTPAKERGPRMVAAFAELLDSLPPVASTGDEPAKRTSLNGISILTVIVMSVLPILYLLGLFGAFGLTEPGSEEGETVLKDGQGGVALVAFVGGAVVANAFGLVSRLVMRPILLTRLRGASDSHRRIGTLLMLIYVWVGFVGFLGGSALTLWLETRP